NECHLIKVTILLGCAQLSTTIAKVAVKKAIVLGHMNPAQQGGIIGGIGPAIGSDALHLVMNAPHLVDQPPSIRRRAEGGAAHKLAGAAQPAQHVFPEAGVIPNAS